MNHMVGDVYLKIIESVVELSAGPFGEFGVPTSTLEDLKAGWQAKLSQRKTAEMPWDPKPVQQPPAPVPPPPSNITNGLTPTSYTTYDTPPSTATSHTTRIKQEPAHDNQYGGLPNGFPQGPMHQPQGGAARAAQLTQQYAMQRGGGLALPGQPQAKPQLHLPAQTPPLGQQQYSPQQAQAMRQHQQQQYHQQQPRIKVENSSPHLSQGVFSQQAAQTNYSQTDGADDAMDQWQALLTQRRAMHAEQGQHADRMMRDHVLQQSAELQSGLMMPLDELPSNKRVKRTIASSTQSTGSFQPSIPGLDGVADDEDDVKPAIKDEDEDAINSDLDDPDDDGEGDLADDDDETLDTILCTYDKVQRVKNKWKCILKDGIMSANGKEWIFHKGSGEFEW